jgi:hypothetical protein
MTLNSRCYSSIPYPDNRATLVKMTQYGKRLRETVSCGGRCGHLYRLAFAIFLVTVGACSPQRDPARKSISDIDKVLTAVPAEAYARHPDQFAQVQEQVGALRASFNRGDYAAVLKDAPAVGDEVQRLSSIDLSPSPAPNNPPEATDPIPSATAEFEIGNGLRFARGQLLDDFKKQHTGSSCFDSTFVGCEIMEPQGTDCPSVEACDHVVYIFDDQKLGGFDVNYQGAVWKQLLAASTKTFGHSQHKISRIGSMSVEMSKWKLADGNALVFVHYSGSDFNGNPIAKPFSVTYGSDSDAK